MRITITRSVRHPVSLNGWEVVHAKIDSRSGMLISAYNIRSNDVDKVFRSYYFLASDFCLSRGIESSRYEIEIATISFRLRSRLRALTLAWYKPDRFSDYGFYYVDIGRRYALSLDNSQAAWMTITNNGDYIPVYSDIRNVFHTMR